MTHILSGEGILDEAGFTYAKGYLGPGGKVNNPTVSHKNWKNIIRFMLNLQAHGKAYYSTAKTFLQYCFRIHGRIV